MTTSQAILAGAGLIALSLIAINAIRPAEAQVGMGQFQLMHHSNTSANAGVFRLNTATGEVSYCFVTANSELVCSHPVR